MLGSLTRTGLAVAALLVVTGSVHAQSNVTVYGLLDAGVDLTHAGKGSSYRVISGGDAASRWGIRGAEDLGDGLSAVFKLESAVLLDTGSTAPAFWLRESSVGLSSSRFGTVTVGRTPTPYWMTSWVLDAFAWGTSGGYAAISRSGATNQQILPLVLSARVDNSLSYVSPSVNGFEFRMQGALGEGSASAGRSYSAASRYAKGAVDVAVAWQRQNGSNNASGSVQAIAVGGSYDLGGVKVYAGYTDEKNSCSTCVGTLARAAGVSGSSASEFRLVNLGVRVPVGLFTAIAQVVRIADRSEYAASTGNRDATWIAAGGEYLLSKRTLLYGSLATVGNRNGSLYALGTGSAQQPAGTVGAGDPRSTTLAVGMRHAF